MKPDRDTRFGSVIRWKDIDTDWRQKWELEFTCSSGLTIDWRGHSPRDRDGEDATLAVSSRHRVPVWTSAWLPGDISGLFSSRLAASFGQEGEPVCDPSVAPRIESREGMRLVLHPLDRCADTLRFYARASWHRKTSPYMEWHNSCIDHRNKRIYFMRQMNILRISSRRANSRMKYQ